MLLAIRDKNIKDLQSKLEERRKILLLHVLLGRNKSFVVSTRTHAHTHAQKHAQNSYCAA